MLRAAVVAEAAGVPSVSLVCEGFQSQALATGRGLGFAGMRLGVLRGHVDAQSYQQMIAAFVEHTVEQIIAGLTDPIDPAGSAAEPEPAALDAVVHGTVDEINRQFRERGWSDGQPIIPPTRERVEAFVAHSGHDPFRSLGTAQPSGRDITVWSVAVNGVMAGCRPEDLAVLLGAAAVLADPAYGVQHSGNTTGADALMILDGPVVDDLGFNHAQGAMRDGSPANTTVGRWLRLFLRNVFGFTPDEHDKATFGNSAKVVLAEDQATLASIGWPTVAAEFGVNGEAITIGRINSTVLIGSVVGSTPQEMVDYLADGLVRVTGWELTHVYGLGHFRYQPLLVLSPMIARVIATAGWSKDDLRLAMFDLARLPAWRFESLIGAWSNLTAGRPLLVDLVGDGLLPPVFAESDDPHRMVPVLSSPDRLLIAVAGDPNRMNAVAMSNDGLHGCWTTAPIDRTPSTDLLCAVPGVVSGNVS